MMDTRKNEHGIALVAVLGLLATVMVLVAAAVSVSQTQRFSTATVTQLGDSVYYNESAMNRAIWLIGHDRTLFPDRAIKPERDQLIRRERFLADGIARVFDLDGIPVEVKICDMNSGINLSGVNPAAGLAFYLQSPTLAAAKRMELEAFRNRLMDYVDSDELLRPNGMERGDYEILGLAPLPRNTAMQFREEVLWIPGGENLIAPGKTGLLDDVNPIPPRGLQFRSGNPHFFSASPELIQSRCDLTDRELEMVLSCRDRIVRRETGVDEAFLYDLLLYEKIKKNFFLTESSYYALKIHIAPEAGFPGRHLTVSLRIDSAIGEKGVQFFQWISY